MKYFLFCLISATLVIGTLKRMCKKLSIPKNEPYELEGHCLFRGGGNYFLYCSQNIFLFIHIFSVNYDFILSNLKTPKSSFAYPNLTVKPAHFSLCV